MKVKNLNAKTMKYVVCTNNKLFLANVLNHMKKLTQPNTQFFALYNRFADVNVLCFGTLVQSVILVRKLIPQAELIKRQA